MRKLAIVVALSSTVLATPALARNGAWYVGGDFGAMIVEDIGFDYGIGPVIPGAGGTQRLPRLVGPARAKELVMSGRFVEAEEALAIGLVDKVVPTAAEVYDAAVALVKPYTTGPAAALRAAKMAVDGGLEMDLASGLAWESQLFAALFATDDKHEGMTAFVEKRRPKFDGR